MSRFRLSFAFVVVVAVAVGSTLASAGTGSSVVVPRGQPVQIAVVLDRGDGSIGTVLTPSIRNVIQMAVGSRTVRGFKVQLNDAFDARCGDDQTGANAVTATTVVSNPRNVAVIGHMCSTAFAGSSPPPNADATALSIYENSGIVTINGSTTGGWLPGVGPNVFNATAVAGDNFDWYDQVKALSSDQAWEAAYFSKFGESSGLFADLYFDATKLLLTRLTQASKVVNGQLVIDRAELASAVRNTTGFCGVTGTINLDPSGYRTNAVTAC